MQYGGNLQAERGEKMKRAIARLIKVKTLVTLALTGCFIYLAGGGVITGEQFVLVFSNVIAFYFGTQHEKNK